MHPSVYPYFRTPMMTHLISHTYHHMLSMGRASIRFTVCYKAEQCAHLRKKLCREEGGCCSAGKWPCGDRCVCEAGDPGRHHHWAQHRRQDSHTEGLLIPPFHSRGATLAPPPRPLVPCFLPYAYSLSCLPLSPAPPPCFSFKPNFGPRACLAVPHPGASFSPCPFPMTLVFYNLLDPNPFSNIHVLSPPPLLPLLSPCIQPLPFTPPTHIPRLIPLPLLLHITHLSSPL